MLKIQKIKIENFRGIKLPIVIEFKKGGNFTSSLIYGRNGTGKSSIVDAWEWFLYHKIAELSKDGISEKDYPHKLSNGLNSFIDVEFTHPTIQSAKLQFNNAKITAPLSTGQYAEFKNYTVYPNFLRYADLQKFVYLTKTEKYKYISKFFGLDKFVKNQTDLQASIKRLKDQLQQSRTNNANDLDKIVRIIGPHDITEANIVAYINITGEKYSVPAITEFAECWKVKDALDKIVKENPVAKSKIEWIAFQGRLTRFYPIPKIKSLLLELEEIFIKLKQDEANITNLILTQLYDLSIETINQLEDKSVCPVCDHVYDGDLIEHLEEKHRPLAELKLLKEEFEIKKVELISKLKNVSMKMVVLHGENSEEVLTTWEPFFDNVNVITTNLPDFIATLETDLKDLPNLDLSSKLEITKIDTICDTEAENKEFVVEKLRQIDGDEQTKNLADDFTNLVHLTTAYTDGLKNQQKVDYLNSIVENMESLFTKLTEYIQLQIQTTFALIQADVIECYNAIESSNPFLKNPGIKLVEGKDKAVEIEIDFVTEKISPAYKYMSESQVNSFGFAIFLACAKHFNGQFKFFILDDIVNSFDAFKRPRVSQLLAEKFNDFQILMLTHDQIFFDTVQRDFPEWTRYKFTSWEYTTGPRFRLAKNYSEEIQELLTEDKPIPAGQTLGRYLEWTFGVLNENLQTPIRYKAENIYTLAEFYDPLVKRFKDKLKIPAKQHKLVSLFDEFETGTIFRNYCAHWKGEATGFTTEEIDSIFKKWEAIENMVYCTRCKSFVSLIITGGVEHVKCNCSTVDLKHESFYE